MARTTNTYTSRFKEVLTAGEWTKNGTGIQALIEGEAVPEGNNYTVALNNKTLTGNFALPTLSAGEIVVKVQLKIFGKAGSAAADVQCSTGAGIKMNLASTTAGWVSSTNENAEGQLLSAFEKFELKSIKAAGGTVYAIYLVITTQTERDYSNATLIRTAATTATAEGTYTSNTEGAVPVGQTTLAFVTVAGEHGATSITDVGGNTWTLDGEAHQGANVAVQIWSCNPIKTLNSTEGIKLAGLPPSARINFAVINTLAEMVGTSKVDVTATGEGSGVAEVSLETPATRATQGDFTALHFGIDQETGAFTATGFTVETVLMPKQVGLTMSPGIDRLPAEGAALKYKGKYGVSGNIAALAVAYKVLANTAGPITLTLGAAASSSAASLLPNAPTLGQLAAAPSTSAASLAVTAAPLLELAAAPSTSSASGAITSTAQVSGTAASSSAATLAAGTVARVLPAAAASSTAAGLEASSPTRLALAAVSSLSGASLAASVPVRVVLAPAGSTSSAEATLTIGEVVVVEPVFAYAASGVLVPAYAASTLQVFGYASSSVVDPAYVESNL